MSKSIKVAAAAPLEQRGRKMINEIAKKISEHGGRAIIFGGYVRDNFFLNIPNNDIDVEVYNMPMDMLQSLLSEYGQVDAVGKSFAVIKLRTHDGEYFDFSLPRRERKTGVGHTAFEIESDSSMTIEEAASRRDFTINAIGYDPLTEEFVDPYNGIQDLKDKILRATSERFAEDPLRVLRGVQFASRFSMRMDSKTIDMCKHLIGEFNTLSSERIAVEFLKLATKSLYPSFGFTVLEETQWINCFSSLRRFRKDFPSDYYTNVYLLNNFMNSNSNMDEENQLTMFFAIMLKGLTRDASVLNEFGIYDKSIISKVEILLQNYSDYDLSTDEGIYYFAEKLCPVKISDYCFLQRTWKRNVDKLANRAQELNVFSSKLQKIVTGKMLIDLGMKPGKDFGVLIEDAYHAQMQGLICDEKSAKEWILALSKENVLL